MPFALRYLENVDFGPPYGSADRMIAMASPNYRRDFDEVKACGGLVSSVRTQAQADLALLVHLIDVAGLNALLGGSCRDPVGSRTTPGHSRS